LKLLIIAKVVLGEGKLSVQCLTFSVETSKFDLANALTSAFELMGVKLTFWILSGWTPNTESEILDVLVPIYEKQTGENLEW
jgi:dipeptidase D